MRASALIACLTICVALIADDTRAQMGSPSMDVFRQFQHYEDSDTAFLVNGAVPDGRHTMKHRASGVSVSMRFSLGRLTEVHDTYISDPRELQSKVGLFSAWQDGNRRGAMQWKLDPQFWQVFPPIGSSVDEARANMVATGVQYRIVAVSTAGTQSPITDWRSLKRAAGTRQVTYVESWERTVLQSGDGNWYAVVDAHIAQGVGAPRINGPYAFSITGSDVFWSKVFETIRDKKDAFDGDHRTGYEAELKKRVELDFLPDKNAPDSFDLRYAAALITAVDSSTLPIATIVGHYDRGRVKPSIESAVDKHLCDSLFRLAPAVLNRRLEFIAKVCDAHHLADVAKLVARAPSKKPAYDALTAAAERLRIEGPPPETADAGEIQKWASTAARVK